ncbi:MAG: hypothetical protein WDN72_10365 [Alphaproteobacteria bacterium]
MTNSLFIVFLAVVALVVAGGIGSIAFSGSVKLVPPVFIRGFVVTEQGTITENVINSFAGQPMFLKVKKAGGILSGSEVKVVYHANDRPCVKEAFHMQPGQKIEFHGIATDDDTVSACGSPDYYIRPIDRFTEGPKA